MHKRHLIFLGKKLCKIIGSSNTQIHMKLSSFQSDSLGGSTLYKLCQPVLIKPFDRLIFFYGTLLSKVEETGKLPTETVIRRCSVKKVLLEMVAFKPTNALKRYPNASVFL